MQRSVSLVIPPLSGGGIAVGWRCTSRCRHCLYGCGPHRRDGLIREGRSLDGLLDTLAHRTPHAALHVGGGEPFHDLPLLVEVVSGVVERGLRLEYVETNAAWVRGRDHASRTLEMLAEHGLRSLLVSASLFHAEFVPPGRTLALVEAASRVMDAVIVWLPEQLTEISTLPRSERFDLERTILERGQPWLASVAADYGVIAGGRGGRLYASAGACHDWTAIPSSPTCAERLASTSHFHVDLSGCYVPGLCAGIVLPLECVPGEIDLEGRVVLGRLLEGGVRELAEWAVRDEGFVPDPGGYSGPCDLCTHVRTHLARSGDYPELGPAGFYDVRSVPGFAGGSFG